MVVKLNELLEKKKHLDGLVRQAKKLAGPVSERTAQARLMDRKRKAERDIVVPPCKDPERRQLCEWDIFLALRTYFPHKFTNPFTADQTEIIQEILYRARSGGDKAVAAPRGEGKTTIAECVILLLWIQGVLRFPLIVAATGPDAGRILDNIKYEVEFNDLLCEDYPEVCVPIRALEGAPQRANMQTVEGERTHLEWSANIAVLPTVRGSKCSGGVLMTRGLDAAIRGIRYHSLRPDFVLIDDPETRESASSDYQVGVRRQTIDRDIAGLGGQGKQLGRLMLCTLQNKTCLAAEFTDPRQKPSWGGQRYAMLKAKPEREDLWEQYVHTLLAGQETREDPDGLKATEFYLANRAEMDRGAVVSNPARFIVGKEHSTLQACYNIIARIKPENFATEYQNDPPEESGPQESGINATLVASRLSEYSRGLVPAGTFLTAAIDIGKHRCYWCVMAWTLNGVGYVVDYGWADVLGTSIEDKNKVAIERAILLTLVNLRQQWIEEPYLRSDGEVVDIDLCFVDSGDGNTQGAVYEFVRQCGKPFVASKGYGDGRGSSPFHIGKVAPTKKIGNGWHISKQEGGNAHIWLHGFDADKWKHFLHERFLTPTQNEDKQNRPGSIALFKPVAANDHSKFARSICSEVWTEEFVQGKGYKKQWVKQHKENHWLDATVMATIAADMRGMSIVGQRKPEAQRLTLRQMAERARRAS